MDITNSIEDALSVGLTRAAASPGNDLKQTDVDKVLKAAAPVVAKEANSIVKNLTNQEPWFQSTILVSAYIGVIGILYGWIYNYVDAGTIPTPAELPQTLVPLGGFIGVIYGRLFNKKPLGE